MTKYFKPLSDVATLSLSPSGRPIRTVHLDDLAVTVAKLPSGLTHFVIAIFTSSQGPVTHSLSIVYLCKLKSPFSSSSSPSSPSPSSSPYPSPSSSSSSSPSSMSIRATAVGSPANRTSLTDWLPERDYVW